MRLFGLETPPALDEAVRACGNHFRLAAVLSAAVNLLYLAPTLYMLQVYDRAVPTAGVSTLLWLTLVIVLALAMLAFLDMLRSRVMMRAALRLDKELSSVILDRMLADPALRSQGDRQQAMREFDVIRQALAGAPALALFDIVWAPVFIIAGFLLHPLLGAFMIAGALALLAIAALNLRANRGIAEFAHRSTAAAYLAQEQTSQRADVVRALGMREAMRNRLLAERNRALAFSAGQQIGSGRYAAAAKFARLVLQSLALGLGAYLAIEQAISIGAIIAASVLVGRALQPIEAIVHAWPILEHARNAVDVLGRLMADTTASVTKFALPAPRGDISIAKVLVRGPDGSERPILAGIEAEVAAGEFIGIIGASGAGKTTLARVIAGALPPDEGLVRIDGADTRDWDADLLARHIGYLPQDSALVPGTIADNISRFAVARGEDPAAVNQAVLDATRITGVHDLIVGLAGGYDRQLGWTADALSAGQRQRIALARAVYGGPSVLVLDEPNSALDAQGEAALMATVSTMRERGATVILATHKAALLAGADKLLLLVDGVKAMFGSYAQVVSAIQRANAKPALEQAEAA